MLHNTGVVRQRRNGDNTEGGRRGYIKSASSEGRGAVTVQRGGAKAIQNGRQLFFRVFIIIVLLLRLSLFPKLV